MSNQGAQLIVLYPRTETSKFDLKYYQTTHMPLAKSTWTPHGIKSFSVTQLSPENQYSIASVVEFESQEHLGKAMADPATQKVLEDVPNFSSEQPVVVAGAVTMRG